MIPQVIVKELIQIKERDHQLRSQLADTGDLFLGYNKEMENLHIENAQRLEVIIRQIGWPVKEKVGQEANSAAMLIVQHAISLPEFQRACLEHISEAIESDQEDKRNYAYLYDRICFNERRPQKFGTQFDWDKEGKMSPWTIENPKEVNTLRLEYGLNTIEEEIAAIRERISNSDERPPKGYAERQQEIYEWSKNTGWIK